MLSRLQIYLLIGACTFSAFSFAYGYQKGRTAGQTQQLLQTVRAYEKRAGIDRTVDALELDAVCRGLGGMPDQCDQLRGLGEAAKGE